MDYWLEHLNNRIKETEDALVKWALAVKRDTAFIAEFSETYPDVAQIYRDWKLYDQDKVALFQGTLRTLEATLEQRKGYLGQ